MVIVSPSTNPRSEFDRQNGEVNTARRPGRFARAGRRTNIALLWLLIGCALSGGLAFAAGRGVAAVLAAGLHGLLALAVIVLGPWKNAIVQRVRRLRRVRWTGWALIAVVVICLVTGLVQLLIGYVIVLGLSPIQLHVGSAIAIVPLLVWHILSHRRQRVLSPDLRRRHLLLGAAGLAGSAVGVTALTGAAQFSGGASRRPVGTGSRPLSAPPATIWLLDRTPALDAGHRIVLPDRTIGLAELETGAGDVRARLDCTSGWYADVTWTGRSVAELLGGPQFGGSPPGVGEGRGGALVVRSVTGYVRTFPLEVADRLWLVTRSNGAPLTAGNGGPVRLVARGYRGFWWVKWVGSIEFTERPSWLQPPFPVGPLPAP